MYEDADDIESLQALLDRSIGGASEHMRSIITPPRRVTAASLAEQLTGMRTLALSTVSARRRPRVSGVDGHFLRGRFVFTTSGTAVKARDMRARPWISAAHLDGDTFGVFVHGEAEFLGGDHPDRGWIQRHLTDHYGQSPDEWGPDIVYVRIRPRWMVGYRFAPE
jgi:hypothetical protein